MHIGGSGPREQMAEKAKAVLDKVKEVRSGDPLAGTASSEAVANTIDIKKTGLHTSVQRRNE
jgi:ethanolamine ammonia-lyase large subunit